MSLLVTENVRSIAVDNDQQYGVLIHSTSDPPFGKCNVFVYKQIIKVGVVKTN